MNGKSILLLSSAIMLLTVQADARDFAPDPQIAPQATFTPPQSPLLLIRTLRTGLADGKAIIVTRTYDVRIVRDGDGFRVDGRFVGCTVEAPPALAGLAQLEQRRADDAVFPLWLDSAGRIRSDTALPGALPEAAITAQAAAAVRQSGAPASSQPLAAPVVQGLLAQRVVTPWPEDLFHPTPGLHAQTRNVALPDGRRGSITVEGESQPSRDPVIISMLRRTITTRLENSVRRVREDWTISTPASAPASTPAS